MYYSLFDWEHDKEPGPNERNTSSKLYFMRDAQLYKLGLDGKCFNFFILVRWLFYGLIQGIYIYLLCFYCLCIPGITQKDGKDLGLWVGGHVTYGTCIIAANLVVLHKFHNYTGWGEWTCAFMIMSFFTILFLESIFPPSVMAFWQVYYIYDTTFTSLFVWC